MEGEAVRACLVRGAVRARRPAGEGDPHRARCDECLGFGARDRHIVCVTEPELHRDHRAGLAMLGRERLEEAEELVGDVYDTLQATTREV